MASIVNNIDLITKYSTKAWDKVYKAESRSAILDAPNSNVQWTGAKTVKIAKFQAGGLKNYYRNNVSGTVNQAAATPFGYQRSSAGLVWEEFTVKMDRAAEYAIELFDNEETDGLALGAATTEISRTIMIPEVDAYCFSKIAEYAGEVKNEAVTKETVFEKLNDALLYFDEHEVPAEDQVIFVSPAMFNMLRNNDTLNRVMLQSDYNKGSVKFTITNYEGRDIVVVPPQRFRTAFSTVTASGEGYTFGYWNGSAEVKSYPINFIVCAKSAVMHVVKYNKVKILSGDVVLAGGGFDGYMLFARVYHDVFVTDNKRVAIYASINNTAALTPAIASGSDKRNKVATSVTSKLPSKLNNGDEAYGADFKPGAGDLTVTG